MSARKKKPRRQYGKANDGTPCVSVTTVIGLLNKPGLMHWAAGVAARKAVQLISEGGAPAEVIERARKAHLVERDASAEAGQLAHAMMEALLIGEDPEGEIDDFADPDVVARARQAFGRFAAWWPTSGYRVHLVEEALVDREKGVAGTLDLLLLDAEDRIVIADLKTGKDVYDEVIVQLGGYAGLLHTCKGIKVDSGLVIHSPVEGELSTYPVSREQIGYGAHVFASLVFVHKTQKLISIGKAA